MKENFELHSLISKLDGLRTLFVYDSVYAIRTLLFNHIIPHFSSKNVYIAVYTETMYRRLERAYKSFIKISPEVKEVFRDVKIIKIGLRERTAFGELYEFLSETTWYKRFLEIIREFGKRDVLILHGFSILPVIYGDKGLTDIIRLLDSANEDLTIIGKYADKLYSERVEALLERFYDVVIRIRRFEGNYLDISYSIDIDQSILADLIPGTFGRFKIKDGEFVRVC